MPLWARLVVALASGKVAFGLVVYLSGLGARTAPSLVPVWVYAGLASAFALLGFLLVIGNRQDPRAAWLGGVLLLLASPLAPLVNSYSVPWPGGISYLRPEALLPAFWWRFIAEFPSPLNAASARTIRTIATALLVAGLVFAAANLSLIVAPDGPAWRARFLVTGSYWLFVIGSTLTAFPVLLWRARTAPPLDRTRVQLFVRAMLLAVGPFAVQVLAEELIPAYKILSATPPMRTIVATIIFGSLATAPFVTAYSVLFDQVVDVRVVVRAALQHALARYTILGLTMIPFAALAIFLYAHRTESLVSMMVGPRPLLLVGAAVGGLVVLRLRHRWLEAVDRRYFREPYDAQQVLARFVADIHAESVEELAHRIRREVERVLHADADVVFANDARTALRHPDGRLSPISATAMLVGLALNDPRPMDVDLDNFDSPLHRLPDAEKRWLAQGAFKLVVALRSGGGVIAGLLVLSAKRSGLAYSALDRHLLSAIAAAAGLAMDNLRLRSTPQSPSEPAAQECLTCSRLNPSNAPHCSCGGAVIEAAAPHMLRGVFRLEQRIGAGGMGVVYRAADLNLGREVAIKTLPRVSAEQAARLRREARAMAAVTHPNLAVIFGIETWQGIPFLVEEFLAGGTLLDRLTAKRMSIDEALKLGVTLAEALEHLHSEGMLHCDVKPSNIGFTQRGAVKLLDFGLARLLRDTHPSPDVPTTMVRHVPRPVAITASSAFAGTPHYMSPETVRGERASPAVDIWALSVVLYEIIAGRRPFEGDDSSQIFAKVTSVQRPNLGEGCPDCPEPLTALFGRLFSLDPKVRPADASAFKRDLSSIAVSVGMS